MSNPKTIILPPDARRNGVKRIDVHHRYTEWSTTDGDKYRLNNDMLPIHSSSDLIDAICDITEDRPAFLMEQAI